MPQQKLTVVDSGLALAETPDNSRFGMSSAARRNPNRRSSTVPETVRVLDVSNPAHPRAVETFDAVTGILQDDARSLIYVANGDGHPVTSASVAQARMQFVGCYLVGHPELQLAGAGALRSSTAEPQEGRTARVGSIGANGLGITENFYEKCGSDWFAGTFSAIVRAGGDSRRNNFARSIEFLCENGQGQTRQVRYRPDNAGRSSE